jgi:hypothetical protein
MFVYIGYYNFLTTWFVEMLFHIGKFKYCYHSCISEPTY